MEKELLELGLAAFVIREAFAVVRTVVDALKARKHRDPDPSANGHAYGGRHKADLESHILLELAEGQKTLAENQVQQTAILGEQSRTLFRMEQKLDATLRN